MDTRSAIAVESPATFRKLSPLARKRTEPVTQPADIRIAGYKVIVELPDPLRIFSSR
jgi:hypothetical protein